MQFFFSPRSGDASTQMIGFSTILPPRLSALVTEVREQKVVPGGLAPRTLMPVAWSVENNCVFETARAAAGHLGYPIDIGVAIVVAIGMICIFRS